MRGFFAQNAVFWTLILGAQAIATIILEQVDQLPKGWSYYGPASGDDPITIYVALAQPKLDDLATRLLQISDPSSESYGFHLTREEVQTYREPPTGSIDSVLDWLNASGIADAVIYDAWIGLNTTVDGANALVGADLALYAYESDAPLLRTRSYSIPESLEGKIDFIFPLVHFMPPVQPSLRQRGPERPRRVARQTTADSDATASTTADSTPSTTAGSTSTTTSTPCETGVTPSCLKQLYSINYTAPSFPPSPARLGVAGFLNEWISYADVFTFLDALAPDILAADPTFNFTITLVNNGTDPNQPSVEGSEAALDMEYALTIGYPAHTTFYSTGGEGPMLNSSGDLVPPTASSNEPYLQFLQWLVLRPDGDLPHVLSMSYSDAETSVPRAYATRVCGLFAQLAVRGVSILVATGDGGAAGTGPSWDCFADDGSGREMFMPTFPASCPWVTAVGATTVGADGKQVGADFSAGGFSNYFLRPAWQEAAVAPYVAGLVAANGTATALELYNASGRATPDISVIGTEFEVVWLGIKTRLGGTSAATPVVAGLVALVNDARLRAGKSPTGWLNPVLYSARGKSALLDITEGKSNGCYFSNLGEVAGWTAGTGYDCVTGLGTVSTFHAFLEALS